MQQLTNQPNVETVSRQKQQDCTTEQSNNTYDLINQDLIERVFYAKGRHKIEAEKEMIFSSKCNHKPRTFKVFSKSINQKVGVHVLRGQLFITYNKLAEIWGCSKEQTRRLVKKFKDREVVKVKRIKDKTGFDLGLLITYNPLFNRLKSNKKKANTPENFKKPTKYKKKGEAKNESNKADTHNKKVSINRNIHTDDVFFDKNEKEKKQIKKIQKEFREIKLNPKIEKRIFKAYDLKLILDYLKLLKLTGERVKNKAGWIVNALKQSYDLQRVDTWRKEQEAEKEARRKQEEQERKRREEERRRQQEQEQKNKFERVLVEKWRGENGEAREQAMYFEALEEFKKSNRIVYQFLMKKRAGSGKNADLLEYLKSNVYVKSKVRGWILEEVRGQNSRPPKVQLLA